MELRIPGPDAPAVAARLCEGLSEAEFAIPGQIVADIALLHAPAQEPDGAMTLRIEALTIAE